MNKTLNKYLAEFRSTKIGQDLVIDVPNMQEFIDSFMENNYPHGFSALQMFSMCEDYSRWLKTPLTLDMFIAVDEEPDPNDDYYRDANGITEEFYEDLKRFQDAQERIIFYGWRLTGLKGHADLPTLYLKDTYENSLVVFGGGEIRCNGVLVEVVGDLYDKISLLAKIAA